jgi:hypothetical protein
MAVSIASAICVVKSDLAKSSAIVAFNPPKVKVVMRKPRPPISEATREKMRQAKRGAVGPNSNRWKGGEVPHDRGYVLLRRPWHPNTNASGYVLAHRFIMAQFLGRPLLNSEQVHHKNGVKTDNRLENLELMTVSEHSRLHNRGKIPTEAIRATTGSIRSEETRRKISATRRAMFDRGELVAPNKGRRKQPDGSFA